jgi:23S rRNA (adenine2503-C2)-methyltransferase
MGEPALNMAVLDVLEQLPHRYRAPGLMPSVSTIAPHGVDVFFEGLLDVKNRLYSNRRFQFQYSIHTTDVALRDKLIPVRKWSFPQMSAYGERFYRSGDRKITLNFALAEGMPVEPDVLLRYFDPERYLVKITPVNPTCRAVQNGLSTHIDPYRPETGHAIAKTLTGAGYDVIISIGEVEENAIGSNCGQYVLKYLEGRQTVQDGYTYRVETIN